MMGTSSSSARRSRISSDSPTKRYWDERAKAHAGSPSATTNDVHLRRLEARTLLQSLRSLGIRPGTRVVDLGCGDGYSTLELTRALPDVEFTGIDYSEEMIGLAKSAAAKAGASARRVHFALGNVLELDPAWSSAPFDVAITIRCLINVESLELQARAVEQIATCLRPGGVYVAIENFIEGHNAMNKARLGVGLDEIPVRWHNRFFSESEVTGISEPYFDEIRFVDFASSYYFATRVVYSAMCRHLGEEPDYDHPIHRLAPDLPPVGGFSPVRKVELHRRRDQ